MGKGVFVSYRRGKHTQRNKQILIRIEGINDRDKAARFIGRTVTWKSPRGHPLMGSIVGVHGRRGVVKARFKKGIPGHAIGAELTIR
jgi:large subunit ribosomal protein L35Ae